MVIIIIRNFNGSVNVNSVGNINANAYNVNIITINPCYNVLN